MFEMLKRDVANKYGKNHKVTKWFSDLCDNKELASTYIFFCYRRIMKDKERE